VLRKYQPGCVFCRRVDGLVDHEGLKVCPVCIERLSKQSAA
jgi:hypothetical protein